MKTLLQINVDANWGSTGRIAEQIGICAQEHGWDSYIAFGRDYNPSQNHLIRVGSKCDVYLHYAQNRLLDREGLASVGATKALLADIDRIQPDVIHLHNIHDHWLNYPLLFEYLAKADIPVVWTQHDLWATTGHCAFSSEGCDKWKTCCYDCPAIPRFCFDNSKRNYEQKKDTFTSIKDMTIVPVSDWLGTQVQQSYLKDYPMKVIKNGVDINVFKPYVGHILEEHDLSGKHILLGVAAVWNDRKGFDDYLKLAAKLPKNYFIVLVGVTSAQQKLLPGNIIGIGRTQSQQELAQLYSMADILLSLSTGETFGMTMAEAYACGTPCIVYDNTAQPEIVIPETGRVVKTGDISAIADTVITMIDSHFKQLHSADCRKRALELYDKNKSFEHYIRLYEEILNNI